MLALSVPLLGPLDIYLLHSPITAPLSLAVVVLLLAIYPVDPHQWTMDRGDTAAILGVGLGIVIGSNFLGEIADDLLQPPIQLQWPVLTDIYLYIVRFVLGLLLLVTTRFIMKLICFRLLPALMPTGGVEEVGKRPWVELPYKVITYGAIGFNCVYTSIHLFRAFGICRYLSRFHGSSSHACVLMLMLYNIYALTGQRNAAVGTAITEGVHVSGWTLAEGWQMQLSPESMVESHCCP